MPNDTPNTVFSKLAGFQAIIPQFDGTSSITPKYFIQIVESTTDAGNCSPAEKLMILKSRIRGDALTQLINSPDLSEETNYEHFLDKFTKYFDKRTSLATRQHQFTNCKMLPNEDVKIYATRVATATNKFFGKITDNNSQVQTLIEQTKLSKFLDGLLPLYKREIIIKDPQTFEEAINFVELLQINAEHLQNSSLGNIIQEPTRENYRTTELSALLAQHVQDTHKSLAALSEAIDKKLSIVQKRPRERSTSRPNSPHSGRDNSLSRSYSPHRRDYRAPRHLCAICGRSNHETSRCFYNNYSNRQRSDPHFNHRTIYPRENRRFRNVSPHPNSSSRFQRNNRSVHFAQNSRHLNYEGERR